MKLISGLLFVLQYTIQVGGTREIDKQHLPESNVHIVNEYMNVIRRVLEELKRKSTVLDLQVVHVEIHEDGSEFLKSLIREFEFIYDERH